MGVKIQDEFTDNPRFSSQLRQQMRWLRDGRCRQCGAKLATKSLCLTCIVKSREAQRKRHGRQRRYVNSQSYRLEQTN